MGMHSEYIINDARLGSLLRDMVDIYSPSWKEEELTDFLYSYLSRAGIHPVRQSVDETRANLLILPEKGAADVFFIGHIDTVPAFDYERFKSDQQDDRISGLGAADMKGGCAAMIEAFCTFAENDGPRFPAALALVVGEEEGGDGILAFLKDFSPSWAIVGEPTNLVPCLGHFGYLELLLKTSGRRVHASLAGPEENAVRTMLELLLKLTQHLNEARGDVVYNIRDVSSSQAGFAVPDLCEASVDLHVPPHFHIGELAVELEEIAEGASSLSTIHSGYLLPDKGMVPDILKDSFTRGNLPWNPGLFRSDSDANLLWQEGVKPVILGPGELEKAHTQEECISFSQVVAASRIYLDALFSMKS